MSDRFHFTLSPATKATNRVLSQREERRASVGAQNHQHEATTLDQQPAMDVAASIPAPIQRWTCANRIG